MFGFWKNKLNPEKEKNKIETENIKNYNEAIKAIKYFMAVYDWEKANKALNEISEKEMWSYKDLINKIDESWENNLILKEKNKINTKHQKKQKEIKKLKEKLIIEKRKYDKYINEKRFKVRFKNIKEETKHLAKTWKSNQALRLLSKFLEENPWNELVINFYNKEKIYILKQIEKEEKKEEIKLKQNAKLEALKLIWQTTNLDEYIEEEKVKEWLFKRLKEKLNFYKKIKKWLEKKKLIDEISLLIQEEDKVKNDIASQKLENIHKGLIKEISKDNMLGYNLYWKILWAHKISGDTFWINETKNKYTLFIADATWHWIKAWFIITLLTRLFNSFVEKKSFKELIYEINNWLKQDLKSMNFITWVFFEIFKKDLNKLNYIWLWHEPMLVYRSETKEIERFIPGWLAAWIRMINKTEDVKVKQIEFSNDDILLTYSDWIVEAKSPDWEFYSIDRLEETFKKIASYEKDINKIYKYIIKDAKNFRLGSSFDDDLTLLLIKRNKDKDIIDNKEKFLEEIGEKSSLSKTEINKLKWKTKKELQEELEEIKKEKQMKNMIKQLEMLWLTWEILKLKDEAKRYIKDWFIHPKINYYLKKAIDNQQKYKISIKEDRLKNKYNVLTELIKKWDYNTVIKETEDIIAKDWNI